MKNNKVNKKYEIIKIISILASMATIIGTIYTFIQSNDNSINIGENKGVVINGDGNVVNQNNIKNLSKNEIKRMAQELYDNEKYEEVIKLYMLDNVQRDSVILNNLAYMYANGIGVKKDIKKAYKYLKKNVEININEEYVLPNYALFLLNSKNKVYIKEGIWVIKHKELADKLFLNNVDYINSDYFPNVKVNISDKDYINFINEHYIDNVHYELLDASVCVENNEFINYELIDSYYENNKKTSRLINRYMVAEKLFSLDNKFALDMKFIDV